MIDSNDCSKEAKTYPPSSVTKLSDWILRSREERTAHIDLTTPCDTSMSQKPGKEHFFSVFGFVNDIDNWKKAKVEFCHLCECHSRNGWCVNPMHLYIGTTQENKMDQPLEVLVESGRLLGKRERTAETRDKMSKSASARTDDRGAEKRKKEVWLERVKDGHIFWFESLIHASEVLSLNCGNLSQLLSGKREKCGGYRVHFWGSAP